MGRKRIVYIVSIIMGILICSVSGILILKSYNNYKVGEKCYEKLKVTGKGTIHNENQPDLTEDVTDDIFIPIDFTALKESNPEIIAWITFPDADIDYPITQSTDNMKYLKLTAAGEENICGSIFLDYRCSNDFTDNNIILYGHNMKDLSMFGQLKNYKLNEDFLKKNNHFTIYTPEKILKCQIFSFYDVSENDSIFSFECTADEMIKNSYKSLSVPELSEKQVITLSTCSTKGKRFIVNAYISEGGM